MRLEGMEALQRQLARAPEVVRKHAAVAVGFSSLRIAQLARGFAPEATGLLKRNIVSQHKDGTLTGFAGIQSDAAFYWRFIEYGTVHMPARPFFRPAAEEGQAPFIRDIADIGPQIEHDLSQGRLT